MENHLGENGDDCKKMYVTSIISVSKVFLEKLLLDKCKKIDLSRKLYLKSLPKRKGTQKHT